MNSLIHGFASNTQGEIVLQIYENNGILWIKYSDNGKGMSERERARIFEPFYTTKRRQGGSGLGLHIVYNLVTQRLNGNIICESTPGVGTNFIIQVPI
jgi:signal transduction histidine kinase